MIGCKQPDSELSNILDKLARLGAYSKIDNLATGYDEHEHGQELEALLGYLGNTFPIPVLEQAVKIMRQRDRELKLRVKDELYNQGLGDEVTLRDGSILRVKTHYETDIYDKSAFLAFLEDQGYGSKIKTTLQFSRGVDLTDVLDTLANSGISYDKDQSVHHKSLETIVRELLENNVLPPEVIAKFTPNDYIEIKRPVKK